MANKIQEKRIELETLEDLYERVQERIKGRKTEFKVVGKYETQSKNWRTGELEWEDEEQTIPKYESKWDHVPKDELTEEDELYIKVYENLLAKLEKLM